MSNIKLIAVQNGSICIPDVDFVRKDCFINKIKHSFNK